MRNDSTGDGNVMVNAAAMNAGRRLVRDGNGCGAGAGKYAHEGRSRVQRGRDWLAAGRRSNRKARRGKGHARQRAESWQQRQKAELQRMAGGPEKAAERSDEERIRELEDRWAEVRDAEREMERKRAAGGELCKGVMRIENPLAEDYRGEEAAVKGEQGQQQLVRRESCSMPSSS